MRLRHVISVAAIAACVQGGLIERPAMHGQPKHGGGPVNSIYVRCPLKTFITPVAPGTIICLVSVNPSNWKGTIGLSGANASLFSLIGNDVIVGASPLTTGTYDITITATP